MKLISSQIIKYKSIDDSEIVQIEPDVTVLVGQNEAGKTAFLQALNKAFPLDLDYKYDIVTDYPRKDYGSYQTKHKTNPEVVAVLHYKLEADEIKKVNETLEVEVLKSDFEFYLNIKYNGSKTVGFEVEEKDYIDYIIKGFAIPEANKQELNSKNFAKVQALIDYLNSMDLNTEGAACRDKYNNMFEDSLNKWDNILAHYIYTTLVSPMIPKFIYFGDYNILPGKVNLSDLKQRIDGGSRTEKDKTVEGLLTLAGIELNDLINRSTYEDIKAKLESISNSVTDKVFQYWTQNQDLIVEFDIRPDPSDIPPFNNGDNLYIRIRNLKHRVTVPFDQRSKGFIWFFSFIVWFDNIKQTIQTGKDLILLLDEPGLSLHALAQADFLKYIADLSKDYQIIYTTHSPFMVPSEHLEKVRMVEDKPKVGTKITDNISHSDQKTIFPLQAALGYSIAQNLFIAKNNLLVEGPADLVYLRHFSNILESQGYLGLDNEITIIPVGGLDKLATFIALLSGNQLNFAVLHDYSAKPDERLETLVVNKLINKKNILNFGMFRDHKSSDIEDMFSIELYLKLFNNAYIKELNGHELTAEKLPQGERIIERINRYLRENNLKLRPSGGFNHYLPANYLASYPLNISEIDRETIDRFEKIYKSINKLLINEE